jgi:hypothetical protein
MKKLIVIFFASILTAALSAGAVKNPGIVSSTADILEAFYNERSSIPPVPSPLDYQTVASQFSMDCFDFLSAPFWAFPHDGGTLYLSEKSLLNLSLPMTLTAYEDLASGKVVLTGTSVGSKKVETLAVVDAPPFAVFDQRVPVDKYRMDVLWPRRVIWTATLTEEAELEQSLLSAEDAQTGVSAPLAMTMSVPETGSDFRVIQSGTDHLDLSVYLPAEFAGATLDLLCSTSLIEGVWSSVLQTNVASAGTLFVSEADIPAMIYETNVVTIWQNCPECAWDPNAVCTNRTLVTLTNRVQVGGGLVYYRAVGNSQVDSDNDGLNNVAEYEAGTDYLNLDSDSDGLLDGEEVDAGENPLIANDVPDEFDSPMQSASNGVFVVLPERCWHAQESSLNLETYGAYD